MKYNVTQLDTDLHKNMQSKDGSQLKSTLTAKVVELETMLDWFSLSIRHCEQQIQILDKKASKEQDVQKCEIYEGQKRVFEDNKLIWNISGFIILVSIDVKTIQIGMYSAESEWLKRFYARQICTIMYESANDIFDLLGKDFKTLISKRVDITSFEDDLKSIRSQLNQFRISNSEYLQTIRNNTSAHKDKNVLKQLEIISQINWSETIQRTMKFEKIVNDLGSFLKKVIDLGLGNLKNSFEGKE